ncbi:glycosyl hydrolase [Serratia proteamaculans]
MRNNIKTGLITANTVSNDITKKIYQWLSDLPAHSGKRLISGVFGGYSNIGGVDAFSLKQGDDIRNLTGKFPAIYAADYARGWDVATPGDETDLIDFSCNAELISHWNKGGLVAISHHIPNPVFAGNNPGTNEGALKTAITNEQFALILQENSSERQRWLSMLDKIALELEELKSSGVTVFYRPLHEMNGEWFWWGATGYNINDTVRMDLYKQLYQDMFNYLTGIKGLNNLLWVFSPDANREYKTHYYPGSIYVDITGLDMYSDNPERISGYQEMIELNKPFSFPEVGPATTNGLFDYAALVNIILNDYPQATLFIPWNSVWSPLNNLNAVAAYTNNKVINLGDIYYGDILN